MSERLVEGAGTVPESTTEKNKKSRSARAIRYARMLLTESRCTSIPGFTSASAECAALLDPGSTVVGLRREASKACMDEPPEILRHPATSSPERCGGKSPPQCGPHAPERALGPRRPVALALRRPPIPSRGRTTTSQMRPPPLWCKRSCVRIYHEPGTRLGKQCCTHLSNRRRHFERHWPTILQTRPSTRPRRQRTGLRRAEVGRHTC